MAGEHYPFPRNYRLTKTDEFSSVFGFRKAVKGNFFMLHIGPKVQASETSTAKARIGFVVAKKLVKQAVRRNTIRRIAREQFRLHCSSLPKRDLILRVMRKIDGMPRKAIATDIVGLLQKVRP